MRFLPIFIALASWLTSSGAQQTAPSTKAKAPAAAVVPAKTMPAITSKAVIVIDAVTGRTLFEKNADEKRAVASTQKLLTALIICEAGNLDRLATAGDYDALAEPTKLYLKPGLQYPRRELLKGLLMKSANDTARCLARAHAGTEDAFATVMNRRAAQLGMKNSRFLNASGLPAEQYSTARDMSLLARAALFQPVIRDLVSHAQGTFTHPDGRVVKLQNTNHLLGTDPYCTGMKTGFTNAAGKCLVSSGVHKGRAVIVVQLGNTSSKIWPEAKALIHWGLGVP